MVHVLGRLDRFLNISSLDLKELMNINTMGMTTAMQMMQYKTFPMVFLTMVCEFFIVFPPAAHTSASFMHTDCITVNNPITRNRSHPTAEARPKFPDWILSTKRFMTGAIAVGAIWSGCPINMLGMEKSLKELIPSMTNANLMILLINGMEILVIR